MRGGYGKDGRTFRGDCLVPYQSSLDDGPAPAHCPNQGGRKPHDHPPCRHGDGHAGNLKLSHCTAGNHEEFRYHMPGEHDNPASPGWNGAHHHDPTLTIV